jgi:hypothetical protein
MKSTRNNFRGEEVILGIGKYVALYIANINQVLFNCKLAGATIAVVKL